MTIQFVWDNISYWDIIMHLYLKETAIILNHQMFKVTNSNKSTVSLRKLFKNSKKFKIKHNFHCDGLKNTLFNIICIL